MSRAAPVSAPLTARANSCFTGQPLINQTVSGLLPNFGWVLTPDNDKVAGNGDTYVPTDGSTVRVFIDGAAVGSVAYDQCPADEQDTSWVSVAGMLWR